MIRLGIDDKQRLAIAKIAKLDARIERQKLLGTARYDTAKLVAKWKHKAIMRVWKKRQDVEASSQQQQAGAEPDVEIDNTHEKERRKAVASILMTLRGRGAIGLGVTSKQKERLKRRSLPRGSLYENSQGGTKRYSLYPVQGYSRQPLKYKKDETQTQTKQILAERGLLLPVTVRPIHEAYIDKDMDFNISERNNELIFKPKSGSCSKFTVRSDTRSYKLRRHNIDADSTDEKDSHDDITSSMRSMDSYGPTDEQLAYSRKSVRFSVHENKTVLLDVNPSDAPTKALLGLYEKIQTQRRITIRPTENVHTVDKNSVKEHLEDHSEHDKPTAKPVPGQIIYSPLPRVATIGPKPDVRKRILGQNMKEPKPIALPVVNRKDIEGRGTYKGERQAVLTATVETVKLLDNLRKEIGSTHVRRRLLKLNNKIWDRWAGRAAKVPRAKILTQSLLLAEDEEVADSVKTQDKDDDDEEEEHPIELWRRKARAVRLVVAVCIVLRRSAQEAGFAMNFLAQVPKTRKVIDQEGNTVKGQFVSWNLDAFKKRKEPNVPFAAVQILLKRPIDRTDADIRILRSITNAIHSFRKYTFDMQTSLCRLLQYCRCQKKRVVIRKGHIGTSVYFIYSGSVAVVLDPKDDDGTRKDFSRAEITTLRKGACFGEIALLENARRSATVVCQEEAEFLVIDKQDFMENKLNEKLEEEFHFRLRFFKMWPALTSWTDSQVRQLAYFSRTENYGYNRVVVGNSQENKRIWFIIDGSCDLLRYIDPVNSSEIYQLKNLVLDKTIDHNATSPWSNPPSKAKKKKRKKRAVSDHSLGEPAHGTSAELEKFKTKLLKKYQVDPNCSESEESSGTTINSYFKRTQLPDDHNFFVSIDRLRDGMCFGLEPLMDRPTNQRFALISKSCAVIHIPYHKFIELCDEKTVMLLKAQIRLYPTDSVIIDGLIKKIRWDHYKKNVVTDVLAKRFEVEIFLSKIMETRGLDRITDNARFVSDKLPARLAPSRRDLSLNRHIARHRKPEEEEEVVVFHSLTETKADPMERLQHFIAKSEEEGRKSLSSQNEVANRGRRVSDSTRVMRPRVQSIRMGGESSKAASNFNANAAPSISTSLPQLREGISDAKHPPQNDVKHMTQVPILPGI